MKDIPLLLRDKISPNIDVNGIMSYHYSIGYNTEDWDFPIENNYYEGEEYSIDHHLKTSGINRYRKRGEFKLQECVNDFPAVVDSEIPFSSKNRGFYSECFPNASSLALSLAWAYIDVQVFDGQTTKTIRIKEHDRTSVAEGEFERLRQWLYNNINNRKKVWMQQKIIWAAEGDVRPGDVVVVVAEINERRVSVSEETSTSSQEVSCSKGRLMKALNVHTDEELMNEMEKHFGNGCGYDIARQFMEDNNIEFHWWGGSN